jgi:hypothetical protein
MHNTPRTNTPPRFFFQVSAWASGTSFSKENYTAPAHSNMRRHELMVHHSSFWHSTIKTPRDNGHAYLDPK